MTIDQCFLPRGDLGHSEGHLMMSGAISGCYIGGGGATGISWLEAWDAGHCIRVCSIYIRN